VKTTEQKCQPIVALYIETSHSLEVYEGIYIYIKDMSISAPKSIIFTLPSY